MKDIMKTKLYINNSDFIAGTTLMDESAPESNNMALHSCVDHNNVIENRKRLAEFLNCSLGDFVCSHQTHSANFYKAASADRGKGAESMDTAIADNDGMYTYEPGLLLCCFTADCVPVLFYNAVTGLTGVIHSGWQGTVQEITCRMLSHIVSMEKCSPGELRVFLGSALSQERFEVDEDVYLKFKALGYADQFMYRNEKANKYHIDNQLVVKKQCELSGINPLHIALDRTCTFESAEGFSYRQDKNCGRHLNFIMKRQESFVV